MPSEFANASSILRDVASLARPPRRIRVSEAAVESVRLAHNGQPWNPALTTYMVEPMDMLASRRHEAVVFVSPARAGKTQALCDGWLAYAVTCDPGDMGIILPTQDNAHDYSKRRLRRLHMVSPRLAEYVSSNAYNNTVMGRTYKHGMMLTLGWPSSSQLAQRDIRYIALSDRDSMPDNVDGEGDPYALARKRTETFMGAGMCLVESSPKRDRINPRWTPTTPHEAPPVSGGILSLYNRGDRRRWYWACLHCGSRFEAPPLPVFNRDLPIAEAAETAVVPCPSCGGIHHPEDKRRLNAGGAWVRDPEISESTIASYWMQGTAAAFQTWQALVMAQLRAERDYEITGNEEALRTTANIDQGIPYLSRSNATTARDPATLEDRAEEWDRGTVPDGVRFLVASIDVQVNRFVVQVHGFGVGLECWIIDRYEILLSTRGDQTSINPSVYLEDWAVINDRVLSSRYRKADGLMSIRLTVCDSGGRDGVTERAYGWWRSLRRRGMGTRVRLVRGAATRSNMPRVAETFPDSTGATNRKAISRGEVPVLMIDTVAIKDAIASGLSRSAPGPSYLHTPRWMPREFYDELCAEVRDEKGWKRIGGARNEALDLLVYARAAAIWLGAESWGDNWEKCPPWARPDFILDDIQGSPKPIPAPSKPVVRHESDSSFATSDWLL